MSAIMLQACSQVLGYTQLQATALVQACIRTYEQLLTLDKRLQIDTLPLH